MSCATFSAGSPRPIRMEAYVWRNTSWDHGTSARSDVSRRALRSVECEETIFPDCRKSRESHAQAIKQSGTIRRLRTFDAAASTTTHGS